MSTDPGLIEHVLRMHLPVAPIDGEVLCICDMKLTFDGPVSHRLHVAEKLLATFKIEER